MHFYDNNQADLEALESFFLRLSGQPAICGWSVEIEKGDIREIFIAKMKVNDIQKDSCIRPGNTPKETLRSELLQETSYATASILGNQLRNNINQNSSYQNSNSSITLNRNLPYEFEKKTFGTKNTEHKIRTHPTRNRADHPTTEKLVFSGKDYSPNHKSSCPARDAIYKP